MPSPTKGPRLGGSPAHERLMLANLATALFEHGRITTTEAKAKRVRPLAERLITFAKRGDLASRRRVMTVIRDKGVVHTLFTDIAPQYDNRQGGYTRITKIGPRKGDNAPMAVIELVERLDESKRKTRAAKPKKDAAAAAAPADEAVTEETVAEEAGAVEGTSADEVDANESSEGSEAVAEESDSSDEASDGASDDPSDESDGSKES